MKSGRHAGSSCGPIPTCFGSPPAGVPIAKTWPLPQAVNSTWEEGRGWHKAAGWSGRAGLWLSGLPGSRREEIAPNQVLNFSFLFSSQALPVPEEDRFSAAAMVPEPPDGFTCSGMVASGQTPQPRQRPLSGLRAGSEG